VLLYYNTPKKRREEKCVQQILQLLLLECLLPGPLLHRRQQAGSDEQASPAKMQGTREHIKRVIASVYARVYLLERHMRVRVPGLYTSDCKYVFINTQAADDDGKILRSKHKQLYVRVQSGGVLGVPSALRPSPPHRRRGAYGSFHWHAQCCACSPSNAECNVRVEIE
jgi:hypothetical protein